MLALSVVALVMALVYGPSVVSSKCQRIVCYYTNWAQYRPAPYTFFPENILPHVCTHIMYAFATIKNNELKAFEHNDVSTSWSKGMYERLSIHVKGLNPNVKILLSVGGWNMGTKDFTDMVSSRANMIHFASTTLLFLRKHKFDGLDLDWEYPANRGSPPEDKKRYIELLQVLNDVFEGDDAIAMKGRLLLTAAVAAGKSKIDTAYDVVAMAKQLDFVLLMTYDLHGSWENFTGHNSPLFSRDGEQGEQRELNLDYAARYWVAKGMPKNKIVIGLATYGRSFTLESTSNIGLSAPATGAGKKGKYTRTSGFLAYYEICDLLRKEDTKAFSDKQHRVPYLVNRDQWVGYEDKQSLKEKVQYMKDNGYGGVMIWTLDLDDFEGSLCEEKNPLIGVIEKECNAKDSDGSAFTLDGGTDDPDVAVVVDPPIPDYYDYGSAFTLDGGTDDPVVAVVVDPPIPDYYDYGSAFTLDGGTDDPVVAVVVDPPIPVSAILVNVSPEVFCKERKSAMYRDPSNCSYYYFCGPVDARMPCPAGLAFNEVGQYCDWISQVPECQ